MFRDREDAGRQLAQKLLHLKRKEPVVLALPRGGVPVGLEIAKALDAPFDLLLVRKIGVPWHPELAAGAVVDGKHPRTVLNEDIVRRLAVPQRHIADESARQLAEIERCRHVVLRNRPPVDVEGRTVIVVDDGIATGATVRAALRALRDADVAWLVLAAPVAPASTAEDLRSECHEAAFLATPADFGAVGYYYDDFRQLTDADVVDLLTRAPAPPAAGTSAHIAPRRA